MSKISYRVKLLESDITMILGDVDLFLVVVELLCLL